MSSYSPFFDITKSITAASAPRTETISAPSGTPFWGDTPGAYDTVRFAKGSIVLPGTCRVGGKGFAQKVQRDKAPGTHGSKIKQLGIQPARIDITVSMWTEDHLRAFERLIPILKEQRYAAVTEERSNILGTQAEDLSATDPSGFEAKGLGFGGVGFYTFSTSLKKRTTLVVKKSVPAGPKALDVYHPMLALFKIRSVMVLEVSIPEPGRDDGVWESKIECEEFVYRAASVKVADQSLDIVESNPRIGKTAATLAIESKKPSDKAKKVE